MKTIKVSEATNIPLDWLVAKCEKLQVSYFGAGALAYLAYIPKRSAYKKWRPTTHWSQMGPIIEREGLNLSVDYQDFALSLDMVQIGWKANLWYNSVPGTSGFLQWATGPTPLVAAARCYVMSKLGEDVDVPAELC